MSCQLFPPPANCASEHRYPSLSTWHCERTNLHYSQKPHTLYGKSSGTEVTIDGEDYLIMRESDVLAII